MKKDEAYVIKSLSIEFEIKKIHAERTNGMVQCDCCHEFLPSENFDRDVFLVTKGALLCDLCSGTL